MQRHAAAHLPATLVQHATEETAALARDLVGEIESLQRRTLGILRRAEQAGDGRLALAAVAEARRNLELVARLKGELENQSVSQTLFVHNMTPEQRAERERIIAQKLAYLAKVGREHAA